MIRQLDLSPALRVYLSIGELETDNPDFNKIAYEHATLAHQTLIAAGVPENRVRFDFIPGGEHHEGTWSKLFPNVYHWLLQP
ncbi:hypothetical protein [Paenibacillus sp. BK033]|uniref:hypothetical protein n=1 Tax=Paenibacillus sp. BK033 TaxID=2512133 RepID=UPI001FB6848E|nr:hypothetical protein [Paenibacillus sp. BK033]